MADYQDFNALLEINNQHYDRWDESEFYNIFQHQLPCVICEVNQQIVGYMIYLLVFDEMKILNLTIDKSWHGLGYGTRLIEHVLNYESVNDISWVLLNVRVDNIKALNLYTRLGFRIVSCRKNYYTKLLKIEDSYLMELDLRNLSVHP